MTARLDTIRRFRRYISNHIAVSMIRIQMYTLSSLVVIWSFCLIAALSFSPPHRGTNRLFLDTAVKSEWESLLPLGIFHGITTNPTLLERAGLECTITSVQTLAKEALSMVGCDEFMCQAWGSTSTEMYNVGMQLSEIDREKIVVKVPVTMEGTATASKLIQSGVRVCLTACYNSDQAKSLQQQVLNILHHILGE